MTIDDFLAVIEDKLPPTPLTELAAFEEAIGYPLPETYRRFLIACNGGYVGGKLWFKGPTPEGRSADAGIQHLCGFREERHFSLDDAFECYGGRIPKALVWVMDDPFGNAICVGVAAEHRGRLYFWDHENEPEKEQWDGNVETAGNIQLLAYSFTDFVAGLLPNE
jgi:hypothetical protein